MGTVNPLPGLSYRLRQTPALPFLPVPPGLRDRHTLLMTEPSHTPERTSLQRVVLRDPRGSRWAVAGPLGVWSFPAPAQPEGGFCSCSELRAPQPSRSLSASLSSPLRSGPTRLGPAQPLRPGCPSPRGGSLHPAFPTVTPRPTFAEVLRLTSPLWGPAPRLCRASVLLRPRWSLGGGDAG